MKEQILKSLETMSKAQLSKEIGITPFILNKFISSKLETIKMEYLEKVKAYYGEDEELPKQDRATFYVEVPELSKEEIEFFNTLQTSSINDKISTLGYINYIFTSNARHSQHWFIRLARYKRADEIKNLIRRLGLAVLCGRYNKKDSEKTYVIKIPSEHYLCKYGNGSTGWTVEPNKFTVKSTNKEELAKEYPEFKEYIVELGVLIEHYNGKQRGYTISERTRKKN